MRLGIDITPLQAIAPGGIGTSLHATLMALSRLPGHDMVLYGTARPMVPFSGEQLRIDVPIRTGAGLVSRSNIAWLQVGVARQLERDRIDVFWGTRHVLPRNARGIALVATAYDFWYETHPDQQPLVNRALNRYVTRSFMRQADVVTAISDATATDARRLFPQHAAKVRTVLLGVDPNQFSSVAPLEVEVAANRFGIRGPYLLALDVYNPRKNVRAILGALSRLASDGLELELVAAGRPRGTAHEVDVAAMASRLGLSDRVRLVGDVCRNDLVALMSGASAFVYPSTYEGFGMPVLEAMACGTPVVCSNTTSLPQVAGGAAVLVDPTSIQQIADAVRSVLSDNGLRTALVDAGCRRVSELTWEATALSMLAAFEDAVNMRGQGGVR